jgi:hypothetical protein
MNRDTCPSDGYRFYQSNEVNPPPGLPFQSCMNPWHPVAPTCPKCGSNRPHRLAGAGAGKESVYLECLSCGNLWQPGASR